MGPRQDDIRVDAEAKVGGMLRPLKTRGKTSRQGMQKWADVLDDDHSTIASEVKVDFSSKANEATMSAAIRLQAPSLPMPSIAKGTVRFPQLVRTGQECILPT